VAVLAIHALAMAFFVGSQLFLVGARPPIECRDPSANPCARSRRFAYGTLVAVAVLS
jgi:putative copper export protein